MDISDIYLEVAPRLQNYLTGNGCSYATACDIVQETFLRLWKRREELADDLHQVSGLAFAIARNYRNDLARKAQYETLGGESSVEGDDFGANGLPDAARPGEAAEETSALKRRLKSTLERMPVQLLETFALSRLGKMSIRDIASGTGTSETNVKVRVHRARELFSSCFAKSSRPSGGDAGLGHDGAALLKALMMLAAVDGEISKDELTHYRKIAEELRGDDRATFEELWVQSVRAMSYIGFLAQMLPPEEIVREYIRETGQIPGRFIAALEQMASADGDYSRIERDCVSALAGKSR